MIYIPRKRWGADESGRWRLEERSQKKERSQKMSREQSNGEDSVMGTRVDRSVDATMETEVELRLLLEADMEPDEIPKDIPIPPGAVGLEAIISNLGEQRRLEPPGGVKPKWPRYGLPIPQTPRPRTQLPGHSRWDSETTGSHLKCRARRIRDRTASYRVLGHSG